ncbi:MAG: alpha/beta hydrolase [Pseudomonadota bacterium]
MKRHEVISADGTRLAVFEDGPSDAQAIVLIHGWSQHHLSWIRQLPLADRFRLIMPDLRGHGASDKPLAADAYNTSAPWAADIKAILSHFVLTDPILVGWSMGGWVVLDYLRVHGDAGLAGIMQIGTSVTTGRHIQPGVLEYRNSDPDLVAKGMYSDDHAENLDATVRFVRACFHQQPEPDDFARMVGFNMMVPPAAREAARRRHEDYRDVAKALTVPVTVHWGRHDRLAPDAMGEEAVAHFPNASALIYEDCGHAPFWEDAARFNADLAAFGQDCQARVAA